MSGANSTPGVQTDPLDGVTMGIAQVNLDTVAGGPPTVYGGSGTLTSCDDSIPDYHFEFKDAKRSGNTLVGRPAILYLKDVLENWPDTPKAIASR